MHKAIQHNLELSRVAHIYGTVHVCCVCMHVPRSQVEGVESLVFIVM